MTTYEIDAAGSPRFTKIVAEMQTLAKRHGGIATYDATRKLWTVRAADGDFQAERAVSFARSAGATVTELGTGPEPGELRMRVRFASAAPCTTAPPRRT